MIKFKINEEEGKVEEVLDEVDEVDEAELGKGWSVVRVDNDLAKILSDTQEVTMQFAETAKSVVRNAMWLVRERQKRK